MRLRRTAVAALLAAGIVVPAVSTAAVAFAHPATTATAQKAKAPKPVKTRKPVQFAASGKVTAVDAAAGTVTVQAKGGTKDVRKRTVTVTVAGNARIKINDKVGTLAAVKPGAKITVTGTRSGDVYTATRVQVSQRTAPVVTPSPAPAVTPDPTTEPAPTTEPSPDTSTSPDDNPKPDDSPSEDADDDNPGDLSD